MKIGITRYELFALTSHLVIQPSPSVEHGRRRLRAWDELGVADLADSLAGASTVLGAEIELAPWRDKAKPVVVDLTPETLAHIIAGCSAQTAGPWADTVFRLRERFERLRDKTYELPAELRAEIKAVG